MLTWNNLRESKGGRRTAETGDKDYGSEADNYLVIGRASKTHRVAPQIGIPPLISSFFPVLPPVRSPRRGNARAGFSILELLIVVMIGGVMMKLSMGRIHDLMSHQRVAHAATAVQNDLEAAFQIAGRNRAPVRISWDATVQQISITDR